jgi:site-specific DNA-methyltransferase (adenine-specific)
MDKQQDAPRQPTTAETATLATNRILHGDCIELMQGLPAECVDLAFADPPFNIGYHYDEYDDKVEHQQYIDWSTQWIGGVHRLLKPTGTFWLAIGDEYAAELKIASQQVGFHCRSWVIWYYTFGVNCSRKFTRSHAHLFHFVKDPREFTFRADELENRVPSARELVYKDKRANSTGRLPDDTWILRPTNAGGTVEPGEFPDPPADDDQTFVLRPQDVGESFTADGDTWHFPRVAGTFKERAGFHGCQMPEQLLGRIVRICSHHGDLVLDPFSGSATTVAVAKKLGRRYLGLELSEQYVTAGRARLESIRVGDRLDGSPEPSKTNLKTQTSRSRGGGGKGDRRSDPSSLFPDLPQVEAHFQDSQVAATRQGIIQAFERTHQGYSSDRLVADPELNRHFVAECESLGLVGSPRIWNTLLFRIRKAGGLAHLGVSRSEPTHWETYDQYLFASEIALQLLLERRDGPQSLDEILCDPDLALQFDALAGRLAPGFQPLDYRWAALRLRKQAKMARTRAAVLDFRQRSPARIPVDALEVEQVAATAGVYFVSDEQDRKIYVGETLNLQARLTKKFASGTDAWNQIAGVELPLYVQTLPVETGPAGHLTWQSFMVQRYGRPRLNYSELDYR